MALNGGISLAVWMGGAAVELDCARRAHLGPEPPEVDEAGAPAGPERRVYATLCAVFRRELVVDIMTGASAGGINGALLAAAVEARRRLPAAILRRKWLDVGDFSLLLWPTSTADPPSLLQGEIFHAQLEEMFELVLDPQPEPDAAALPASQDPSLLQREVLLDVMTTALTGTPRQFVDAWRVPLIALEYRAPARFRRADDFTAALLARASRASASFPVAFEPEEITELGELLDADTAHRLWAIDGGLLENAPIRYAIDLIPTRPARRPVRRFLCYVNADPQQLPRPAGDPDEPDLRRVLGSVVGLPRDGRFVDQLYAVEDAVRRADVTRRAVEPLLRVGLGELKAVAGALLPAYSRARCVQSLEELFGNPGDARRALVGLPADDRLPWVPRSLAPSAHGLDDWDWGFRAAQRVLFLELDALGVALHSADGAGPPREALDRAWLRIQGQVEALEALRQGFLTVAGGTVERARQRVRDGEEPTAVALTAPFPYGSQIGGAVHTATASLLEAAEASPVLATLVRDVAGVRRRRSVRRFVERALAIEVIRRAFPADRDVETAQELRFVQLTPATPAPLLSPRPVEAPWSPSPERKLTGVGLHHFAGFYRRSWRANDFMWGRLDAADRIVQLLADEPATRTAGRAAEAAAALAAVLRPEEGELAAELSALADELAAEVAALEEPDERGVPAAVRDALRAGADPAAGLRTALAADLAASGGGLFTRTLAARAAQLEVLATEFRHVAEQSELDWRAGSSTRPVPAGDTAAALALLRGEPLLVERLGALHDPDEAVSDLAFGQEAHALAVALAAIRGTNVALGHLLAVARIPILALAGSAARSLTARAALWLAFAGAATYVAARLASTAPHAPVTVKSLWTAGVLLYAVAALALASLAAVPAVRARQARSWTRRLGFGAWAAALLAALVAPALVALFGRGIGAMQLVATPQLPKPPPGPPDWLAATLFALVFSGVLTGPWAPPALLQALGKRLPLSVTLGALAGVLAGWSSLGLFDLLRGQPDVPRTAIAAIGFAAAGVGFVYAFARQRR